MADEPANKNGSPPPVPVKPLQFYLFESKKDSTKLVDTGGNPPVSPTAGIFTSDKPLVIYLPGDGFGHDPGVHEHSVSTVVDRIRQQGYKGDLRIVSMQYPDSKSSSEQEKAEFQANIKGRQTNSAGVSFSPIGQQLARELSSDIQNVSGQPDAVRQAELNKPELWLT